MPRCALVFNGNVVGISERGDPNVQTRAGYRWMLCSVGTKPAFDPASETVEGPSYTVNASDVTETFTKRALTAQESSDAKDAAIASLNGSTFSALFRVLFNFNNRIRTLEGQATMTASQFKAAIKALL